MQYTVKKLFDFINYATFCWMSYNLMQLKLKKIKTKFLRCTGYLNSIKNPIKQDLLQILVLVRQQNFLNC